MANTYTLISSTVLGSAQSNVTFSSISNAYTDLVLRLSIRNATTANSTLYIQYNSDTSSNYNRTTLQSNGTTPNSINRSSDTELAIVAGTNNSSYTSNVFSNAEIYIPNYLVNSIKPIYGIATTENNATESYIVSTAALWNNTAAITTIKLFPTAGNFATNSSFYLYGIKNS